MMNQTKPVNVANDITTVHTKKERLLGFQLWSVWVTRHHDLTETRSQTRTMITGYQGRCDGLYMIGSIYIQPITHSLVRRNALGRHRQELQDPGDVSVLLVVGRGKWFGVS